MTDGRKSRNEFSMEESGRTGWTDFTAGEKICTLSYFVFYVKEINRIDNL